MVAKLAPQHIPHREDKPATRRATRPAGAGAPLLDPLVHERVRLGIVSALAVNTSVTFPDLKKLLNTSDGNLSVHARKLEEAGYISCSKSFDGRIPRTEYRLTTPGRQALERYLNEMEGLIDAARNSRV